MRTSSACSSFKTHKTLNAFQKRNFLISKYWWPYRIVRKWAKSQCYWSIPPDTTGTDRMRDEELISRKMEYLSTTNDLLRSEYCLTKRVLANSIRIDAGTIHNAIDFSNSSRKKGQASIELLKFFKHRLSTATCLIERAGDNLIIFQVVVKKELSKFELIKCCCIISNSDHRQTL